METPQVSTNTDLALSGYSIIVLKTPNIKFPDLPELRIFFSFRSDVAQMSPWWKIHQHLAQMEVFIYHAWSRRLDKVT